MKNVIQTYLQGSRHKKNNQPCEDRTYSLALNGVDAIALADGAGSHNYPNAAVGADCVSREICRFFCDKFDELYETEDIATIQRAIMVRCQNALSKKAEQMGLNDISTMASTLLAVAVKDGKAISCHLGDGAIGAVTDDSIKVISAPENGEFAGTTYFMTLPNAEQYIHFSKFDVGNTAIYFLMSDGTCDYSYDDVQGVFLDGAAKLALMVYEKMGELKLTETVQKHLIESDPASDDCSFIALKVCDKKPSIFAVNQPEKPADEPEPPKQMTEAQEIEEALKLFQASPRHNAPSVQATQPMGPGKTDRGRKTNYVIIAAGIVLVIAAIIFAVVTATPHNKSKDAESEKTTVSTNVTQEISEATTQKTVETEPNLDDTTKQSDLEDEANLLSPKDTDEKGVNV
ncbi:MAG: PP2C family serine/threonine-protein phosphatase [Eubacterium sp.]